MATEKRKRQLEKKLRDLRQEAEFHKKMASNFDVDSTAYKNCNGRLRNTLLDIKSTQNLIELELGDEIK
jgi:hypothetical protein